MKRLANTGRISFLKIKRGRFALVVFFFAALMASCGPAFEDTGDMTVLRYNEDQNITSLDPVFARNQANIWAVAQLFNGLVELDEQLEVRPAIARSWEISDDGLLYTFSLREDVYFHDNPCFTGGEGRLVRAEDFVYSLNRLISTSLNPPGSWVMNPVARKPDGSLNVTAPNDTLLRIRLERPFPPFLSLLAMQYCSVVPREAVEKYGRDFRRNPVGTGPFHFAYWKEGVKLVYRKNEKYFEFDGDKRLPYLDAVSIRFIQDRQTAFLEFIQGNLDLLTRTDPSYQDELLTPDGELQPRHQDNLVMITMPFLNSEYLGMVMNKEKVPDDWPMRSVKIRRAVNYGFDREKMLRFMRNNIGTPAHAGFVPVGMPGFTENTGGYTYDPEKALRLLEEAGYPGGVGLPGITLHTTQAYQDIAQYIQFELSGIGITMDIDVMPPATLREMMANTDAPFFRGSWIADYPDAENYLALFYSKNKTPDGPNYTHFQNEAFDYLYQQALSETDDSARHAIYHKMDSLIISEAPKVFLYYDQSMRFTHKYVKNMTNNPLNHLVLKRVRIEQ